MTTRRFLLIVAAGLGVLTVVAMIWRPRTSPDGRTPLVWVTDNNPARSEQIENFNRANPDLALGLDYGNAGLQKIILQCSSGVGPDIFDYGDDQLQALAEAGVVWDVTSAAQEMGFSAASDTWPAAAPLLSYDGRQYGYPCNLDVYLLIYNKNVFDDFGVPYPSGLMTMDEFFAMAERVNSRTNPHAGRGGNVFAVSGFNWRILFGSLRGEYFSESGLPVIAGSPALRKAFETHREMIFTRRLMPTSVEMKSMSGQGGWGATTLNQFAAGKFAMTLTGQWSLIAFTRMHRHQTEKSSARPGERPLRLGAVLIPRFSGHPPCYRLQTRLAGINAHSPRRTEALKFLQYLAGPVYSESINRGMDALPGNPKYADLGLVPGPPDLARMEMHAVTKEAVVHGYSPRRSPFLLTSDVVRVLDTQVSRMESNPGLSVDKLLRDAQAEIDVLLRRNLERNPELMDLYRRTTGGSSTP